MTLQNVRFKGLVKTTAELESDKFAGRIGWNSTLARFVAYFNPTNYATMARKDIAETFPGLSATNLTQNRVVAVGANGQLVDDAGLTRTQTSGVTTSLTVGDGNVAGAISILSNAAVGQETSLLLGEAGATKLQIRRTASGVIDFRIPGVDIPISFPEVAGGDIALGGSGSTKRDVNLTGNLKLAGTQRISSAGRFDASSLYNSAWAGGGVRMLATDNVGMGYAMDAATARATIGAQAELGYTPANKAGDTFTGQVVITDPTNVVAQPKLLVSVGGGSATGMIGFHSDGAASGSRNWASGVSRDNSCYQINCYTDDWSGRNECARIGIDYIDLSNAYANASSIGYRIGGIKVVGGRKAGWSTWTGTASRASRATRTVVTASASYTQSEVTALMQDVQYLMQGFKALVDDFHATAGHGLIGT